MFRLRSRPGGMIFPWATIPWVHFGPFPQEMVDAANEQMDYFVAQIEKRGAVVERIDIQPFMFNKPYSSPFGLDPVKRPRRQQRAGRHHDSRQLHHRGHHRASLPGLRALSTCVRFSSATFKEDPESVHFAAPLPMLTDESYVKNYYYLYENVWTDEEKKQRLHNWEFQLTEKEVLWDAADAMRFGKDIFHQGSCVTNKAGMDWLKRMCSALGLRLHHVLFDTPMDPKKPDNFHPWHIDVNFVPLRPGLCIYNPDWAPRTPEVWELFKKNDWELIPAARPTRVHKNKVYLTGLYEGKSWISMNTFSQDPKTVYVEAGETAYCEQLDKLGFDVVPIPYEKVIPFGGALHCTTLDVYREGDCEDYFPNQVEGY